MSKYEVKVYDEKGGRFCLYETPDEKKAERFGLVMKEFFDLVEIGEKNVN